ncbi:MAG: hypothetical protein ACHQVS_00730 [Candidatus Babeliales bacterium]
MFNAIHDADVYLFAMAAFAKKKHKNGVAVQYVWVGSIANAINMFGGIKYHAEFCEEHQKPSEETLFILLGSMPKEELDAMADQERKDFNDAQFHGYMCKMRPEWKEAFPDGFKRAEHE